ncbi:MAG: RDD family protein [Bryobacteraceae bacterium]
MTARFLARLLDLLFMVTLGVSTGAIVSLGWMPAAEPAAPAGLAVAFAYLLLGDAAGGGRGPGKRVAGIRAVDARSGRPCPAGRAVIRTAMLLCGPVDWLPALGRRRRRLGDAVARTAVIEELP